MDDFEHADSEFDLVPTLTDEDLPAASQVIRLRDWLVKSHHKADGLIDKLHKAKRTDAEAVIICLIDELIGETDSLLGNELVAAHNGDLRDSSVISYKRAETLEKAIKAVQAKRAFEKESGIDIESPDMLIIFKYFMSKVKETFDSIGMHEEQSDIFFQSFSELTEQWKKDLTELFEQE